MHGNTVEHLSDARLFYQICSQTLHDKLKKAFWIVQALDEHLMMRTLWYFRAEMLPMLYFCNIDTNQLASLFSYMRKRISKILVLQYSKEWKQIMPATASVYSFDSDWFCFNFTVTLSFLYVDGWLALQGYRMFLL